MNTGAWVELELHVGMAAAPFRIRVREAGDRSTASVACGSTRTIGIGATAREALVAALAPFGSRTAGAVMAAPAMFAASAALLATREVG
jgi:hypothetical protein